MASCITPLGVKNKMTKETIAVPCGKCPNCIKRKVSAWSFRLMAEEKISTSAHFVTLTYNSKYVPLTKKGFMQISKNDLQLFFKRLRKRSKNKIKYYAVGEYGGNTLRPHYHIILFNADPADVDYAWHIEDDKGVRHSIGQTHFGSVTGASIGYTLKYISKKGKIPLHKNDDRTPEFSLMSKKLGACYITAKSKKFHHADLQNRMYVQTADGKKVSMPRYYKDKIYEQQQRKAIGYFQRQQQIKEQLMCELDPNYVHNKVEADKAAFKKMEKDATKADRI